MLRLKAAIQATIYSAPVTTSKDFPEKLKELLVMPTYWDLCLRVCQAVYFLLQILHLGNSKEPGFDHLHYYIQRFKKHLKDNAKEINLAGMSCSANQPMYSFLNRFFASGRVQVPFKYHQSADDHKHVVKEDPRKNDEPDDLPRDNEGEESASAFTLLLQKQDSNKLPLSERIGAVAAKRLDPMKTRLATAGWLTCPVKEIQEDAMAAATQEDFDIMVGLFLQWTSKEQSTKELQQKHEDEISHQFLREFHDFCKKAGVFDTGRPRWRNTGIKCSQWHWTYSLHGTKYFGAFCVRLHSKILGSSNTERSFKQLKDVWSKYRTSLTPDRATKQEAIMGHHSQKKAEAEIAVQKQKHFDTTGDWEPEFAELDEDDFFSLGVDKLGHKIVAEEMPRKVTVIKTSWRTTKRRSRESSPRRMRPSCWKNMKGIGSLTLITSTRPGRRGTSHSSKQNGVECQVQGGEIQGLPGDWHGGGLR